MHTFWKKKKKPCDLRSFSWFFHPFKAELGSHCCIFRDVSIFISGLHGRWWHGFGTWTKQERSDRLLVMSSLCLGKATETDYFPDFSFFPYFTFFFFFLFSFFLPNTKPHFHTNSAFGASYPSNVITKGSRWPSHRPTLLWLHVQVPALTERILCCITLTITALISRH